MMGDAVNFASRVEGANKVYGTRFLVNARTAEMASDWIGFREIDRLVVEGKQEPELVFEVLGRKGEISSAIEAMAERFAEGSRRLSGAQLAIGHSGLQQRAGGSAGGWAEPGSSASACVDWKSIRHRQTGRVNGHCTINDPCAGRRTVPLPSLPVPNR